MRHARLLDGHTTFDRVEVLLTRVLARLPGNALTKTIGQHKAAKEIIDILQPFTKPYW